MVRLSSSFFRPIQCGFLLIPWVAVVQPVMFFFSRGNCSICSCRLAMSIVGGELRIFLSCRLELEPLLFLLKAVFLC